MYLDFTSDFYRSMALSKKTVNYENSVTSEDAFLIVLNGLDYETIDNLCVEIAYKLSIDPQEVYELIQSRDGDEVFNGLVLNVAYDMIHSNKDLGNKIINGRFNASSWIAHSLYEGELAAEFAASMGLNPDTAMKLGILHDVGRKFDHTFMHTIKGFEYLIELGYIDEAYCTLTHSFLSIPQEGTNKGNRCANCDPAIEGFYIDEHGNGVFEEGSRIDGITTFLGNYEYNPYDIILNISDLMAKSDGITSPYDRMMDVYSRKTPDPRNSPFFKVCFINSLNSLMHTITQKEEYASPLNITDVDSLEELDESLKKVSTTFMSMYKERVRVNSKGNKKTV